MNQEILYHFFEGKATFDEETAVRNWMDASAENKKEFFRERKLFDAMLLLADAGTGKSKKTRLFINRSLLKELCKIAAIVTITLASATLYRTISRLNESVAMHSITVPAGQRVNLTLPDGTNVWLNARSQMKYPVTFGKNNREVTLDGEAYFDVTPDKEKPFLVQTFKYSIKVLGTKFNVEAYSDTKTFETSLMEGAVTVTSLKNTAQSVALTPNNKVTDINGTLETSGITDYNNYKWKDGLICFKDRPFTEIMKEFEKCYGVKIVIENQKVQGFMFTGKFRHSDGVNYALGILKKNVPFTYQRDDEKQIIYIK